MSKAVLSLQTVLWLSLGCQPSEREHLQPVQISLKFEFTTPPEACLTDDLAHTVCYANVIEILNMNISKNEYKLIEHLSYSIWHVIKAEIAFDGVLEIKVHKLRPPIQGLDKGVIFRYKA